MVTNTADPAALEPGHESERIFPRRAMVTMHCLRAVERTPGRSGLVNPLLDSAGCSCQSGNILDCGERSAGHGGATDLG